MKPLAVAAVVTISICAHAQVPYKAPAESAATVSKVPFAEGHPVGEQFRALFNKCDEHDTCSGKPQSCSSDKSHNAALLQLPGAVLFYEAKMAIDIDGSQLAARLYQERKQAGKSVIDQPDTSLRYSDGTSLDADSVPYIAVPGGNFRTAMGIDKGDIAAVVYRDALSYALVGMSVRPARSVRDLPGSTSNWGTRRVWLGIAMVYALASATKASRRACFILYFRGRGIRLSPA
jgi:Fungal chitosanase of glycosyl hydrolase group 75